MCNVLKLFTFKLSNRQLAGKWLGLMHGSNLVFTLCAVEFISKSDDVFWNQIILANIYETFWCRCWFLLFHNLDLSNSADWLFLVNWEWLAYDFMSEIEPYLNWAVVSWYICIVYVSFYLNCSKSGVLHDAKDKVV